MKYKLQVVASLGAVALMAAACGGSDSSSSTSDATTAAAAPAATTEASAAATTEAAAKPVKVSFIVKAPIDYFNAMTDAVKKWAADHPEADITYGAGKSNDDSAGEIDLINAAITNGVQAIAIAPQGPAVQPALEKAVAAGIKVVLLDNDLPDMKDKTAVVSTDNFKAAQSAGDYITANFKAGDKIGVLSGVPGVPALDARVDGMKKNLSPDIKVVDVLPTSCDQQKGVTAAKDLIQAHPDIVAIYAACGPPALGAVQVLKQKNLLNKIKVIGFDALPDEAKAIIAGDETASVAQFPGKMGVKGVETAIAAAQGTAVEPSVDTGSKIVDSSNAAQFTTFQ